MPKQRHVKKFFGRFTAIRLGPERIVIAFHSFAAQTTVHLIDNYDEGWDEAIDLVRHLNDETGISKHLQELQQLNSNKPLMS